MRAQIRSKLDGNQNKARNDIAENLNNKVAKKHKSACHII